MSPSDPENPTTPSTTTYTASSVLDASRPFGGHRLVRLLGQGGFAEVWEAERLADGRRLALKTLRTRELTEEARHRFHLEGTIAASLSHSRTVYVFSAELIEGHPVIAMELMTGGTLQDWLDRKGPMDPQAAVDSILDVIEGLEAAACLGIVHRDVKPSNCFLDGESRVKIGDFGIARSTERSTGLTATGAFIGTPAFAAPEQFLGQRATHLSDQYSVGATLYALLTGHPPFRSYAGDDLLLQILSKPPVPFAKRGVRVPRAIRSVAMRLLSKDPSSRYPDYASLRSALQPLSSRDTHAPDLVRRFGAYLIDVALSTLVVVLVLSWFSGVGLVDSVVRPTLPPLAIAAVGFLVPAILFGAFELLWQRTPGKRAFGLCVLSARTSLSASQILIRNTTFWGLSGVAGWAALAAPGLVAPFSLLGAALPCLSMRPSNAFAGLHEVVSGTRVRAVRAPSESHTQTPDETQEITRGQTSDPRFGPYRLVRDVWRTDREALLVAFDDLLGRRVWIHESIEDVDPDHQEHPFRPTRLQWLQGGTKGDSRWDAFEAPSGAPLLRYLARRGPIGWSETRELLLDLLTEMEAVAGSPSRPERPSLEHFWVDGHGQLKVAPFAMTGKGAGEPVGPLDWSAVPGVIATLCLEGRVAMPTSVPRVALPGRAWQFLVNLCREPLDRANLPTVVLELRDLCLQPPAISRPVRLTQLFCAWSLPAIVATGAFLGSYASLLARSHGDRSPAVPILTAAVSLDLAMVVLGVLALPSLVAAYAFRGGPLLALFGMQLRGVTGERASRARCLYRAVIGLSPAFLISAPIWILALVGGADSPRAGAIPAVAPGSPGGTVASRFATSLGEFLHVLPPGLRIAMVLAGVCLAGIFLAGVLESALHPERGPHDRIARTRLVPR